MAQDINLNRLTVEEYAESWRTSRSTVFVWLQKGMPSIKAGKRRIILKDRADAWLMGGGAVRNHRKPLSYCKKPVAVKS